MLAARTEQYVVFRLANEKLAIGIREIDEIIKLEPITPVPNSKLCIKGVINLRGRIIPVISLCKRLGMAEAPLEARSRIVVVQYNHEAIGIIVDAVERVAFLQEAESPLESQDIQGARYMSGIGICSGELISILSIGRLLGEG